MTNTAGDASTIEAALTRRALRAQAAEPAQKARPVRSVLGALGTGLSVGLLLSVIAIAALAIVIPAVTGSTTLTVMTSSMQPALPPGTMIVVRPTPVDEIVPGDIVTFQLRSGEPALVTHRVAQQLMAADGSFQFITRGDNNPQPDIDVVREVQVRGTVWYAIPWLGYVTQWVTGSARAVIVPLVVIALALYAVWMITSGMRDKITARSAR